jgi:hypothetical protein
MYLERLVCKTGVLPGVLPTTTLWGTWTSPPSPPSEQRENSLNIHRKMVLNNVQVHCRPRLSLYLNITKIVLKNQHKMGHIGLHQESGHYEILQRST